MSAETSAMVAMKKHRTFQHSRKVDAQVRAIQAVCQRPLPPSDSAARAVDVIRDAHSQCKGLAEDVAARIAQGRQDLATAAEEQTKRLMADDEELRRRVRLQCDERIAAADIRFTERTKPLLQEAVQPSA